MPISDVWADWTTTPNSNTPAGSAIPEIDDEFRNVKAELKKNCVTLTGNQTITGVKSFSSLPDVTTATPSGDSQAVNKKYVDNLVSTSVANGLQSLLATGTKCFFCQASAPTGWTQDTTHNDRVLRVVSGTGAGTGGGWTISGISVNEHQLTIDEIPPHNHTYEKHEVTNFTMQPGFEGIQYGFQYSSQNSGSTGNNWGHSHNLTIGSSWRPAYVDIILATRN